MSDTDPSPEKKPLYSQLEKKGYSIANLHNGDQHVFTDVYNTYAPNLTWKVKRIIGSQDKDQCSEDIVQETFIRLWKNRSSITDFPAMATWIYKVSYNLSIDTLRKRNRINNGTLEQNELELRNLSSGSSLQEYIECKDILQHVFAFSEKMSPRRKIVFQKTYINNLNDATIAEQENISEGAVRAARHFAIESAREFLGSSNTRKKGPRKKLLENNTSD